MPAVRMSYLAYYFFWAGSLGEGMTAELKPTIVKGEKETFHVMSSVDENGKVWHHGCVAGTATSRSITDSDLSTLRVRRHNQTNVTAGGLTTLACESKLESCMSNIAFDMWVAITSATNDNSFQHNYRNTFTPTPMKCYTVNPTPTSVVQKEKGGMTQFMKSTMPPMAFPTENAPNLAFAVDLRITKQRPTTLNIKAEYWTYVKDFYQQLYPNKIKLAEEEEVRERQNRPTQRRILDDASAAYGPNYHPSEPLRQFGKMEPVASPSTDNGGEVKAKRIITIMDGESKYLLSRATIAMSRAIKQCHFYVFGKSLTDVAKQVDALCAQAIELTDGQVLETDISKMDGSVNPFFRLCDDIRDDIAFEDNEAKMIIEARHGTYNRKTAVPGNGISQGGTELGSGSPDTSQGQSERAALMEYITLRDSGAGHELAFSRIGLHGGDDGLSMYSDPQVYKRVCGDLGMTLKVKTVDINTPEGRPMFLGRIYGDGIGRGELDSMASPTRLLSQLPYTRSTLGQVVVGRTKAFAAALNDKNTPYAGPLCERILKTLGEGPHDEDAYSWNALVALAYGGAGYPNNYGDWMDGVAVREGILGGKDWEAWLNGEGDWSEPPPLKIAHEVPVEQRALIGDVLHNPEEENSESSSRPDEVEVVAGEATGKAPAADAACKQFEATGKCTYGNKCKFWHEVKPKGKRPPSDNKQTPKAAKPRRNAAAGGGGG